MSCVFYVSAHALAGCCTSSGVSVYYWISYILYSQVCVQLLLQMSVIILLCFGVFCVNNSYQSLSRRSSVSSNQELSKIISTSIKYKKKLPVFQ